MSVSLHVVGFREADEQWNRMKTIYEACSKAGVEIPEEVEDFFDGEEPGDRPGMEVKITDSLEEWEDDSRSGFEMDVSKLPKDVKKIRFYMSC